MPIDVPIEAGQAAPDFTLRDQDGADVVLSSFRGAKNVVLVFYPFAFSGPCTGELGSLRDRIAEFDNDDTVTLAVSCDSVFAQKAFAEQQGFSFAMLADHWPHGGVAQDFGVLLRSRGTALRATFIIDKQGRVAWRVAHGLGEVRDVEDYARVLASL
jgi:peroxiredoxin